MSSYPKWLYGASGSVLVQSPEEHEALDGQWHESPADVVADVAEADVAEAEEAPAKRRGRPPKVSG